MVNIAFFLMGPTASGKTALACDWVQRLPFEIISVDSAMIYRDMNIGTAKPDTDTLQHAPHHLIDIRSPIETYSAAEFCKDATALSDALRLQGKIPLFVGGTMMYFRALQQGLSVLPEADAALRSMLVETHDAHGAVHMHAWLTQVDPISAARIHPEDTQRTQRALEVYLLTKRPLSEHLQDSVAKPQVQFINLSVFPENRMWLHQRIAQRFDAMLAQGFLDEVVLLVKKWQLTREHVSMKSVGYRQALDYLAGIVDYTTFREQGIAATRQLAKRQLTWLRSWPNVHHYDPEDRRCSEMILRDVHEFMEQRLKK